MFSRCGFRRISFFLILAAAAGCATARTPREIAAREHVAKAQLDCSRAQTDPLVAAGSAAELAKTQIALEEASRGRDFDEMDHLAYLAERQVQIAVATARLKAAREKGEELRRENDRLIRQLVERARQNPDPEASRREDAAAAAEGLQGGGPQ